MAKQRSLAERILIGAYPRIAGVLKPFPKDAEPADIEIALTELAKAKLIHPDGRSPNLTRKGVEAARACREGRGVSGISLRYRFAA